MRKLMILGSGGHGKVIADAASETQIFDEIAFLDDDISNESVLGYRVVGNLSEFETFKEDYEFIVGIGDNKLRQCLQENLEVKKCDIATIIHPKATVSQFSKIGVGSVIMAGAIINAEVTIGKGVIINTLSSIDHDCRIDDYAHISPRVAIAGNVVIGARTWIGIGTSIIQNIVINGDIIVGAGSNVIKNHHKVGIYYGNPSSKKE